MKKISLFIFVLCVFLLTGCNDKVKEVKNISDFENASTTLGLNANSSMANYTNSDYITDAMKATKDNIEIEMIIYDTAESAEKVQNGQIDGFMGLKSANAIINKDKGKNYYKYSILSNGYYNVTSRIDNTLIFCKTKAENKDIIINLLNELEY